MLTASERAVRRGRVNGLGRELTLVTWSGPAPDPEAAAEEAYAEIDALLRARGAVPVQERVFAGTAAAAALRRGRARATGSAPEWAVPPTCIEGAPVGGAGLAGIQVIAACGRSRLLCEGNEVYGRVVEAASGRVVGLADVGRWCGRPEAGPAEAAEGAIGAAAHLLSREGLSFRDVARTWFFLRDILDWYGSFNSVRNAAFRRLGLVGPDGDGQIPASTGIAGRNHRGGHCTLDLLALEPRAGGQLEMRRLHNRRQNEATEYGSAFARGMEVVLEDARYVFVSGTASIDDRGQTLHVGDFEAQVRYTLEAVASLLEGAGGALADISQATAFLKRPADAAAFERVVGGAGLGSLPLVTAIADVCRPELLFEIDATAVLPRGAR
jgi:enamine deaminase RidA (YjgF/YER057c/UK114 family)